MPTFTRSLAATTLAAGLLLGAAGSASAAQAPAATPSTTTATATAAPSTTTSTITFTSSRLVGPFATLTACNASRASFQASGYRVTSCVWAGWLRTVYPVFLPPYPLPWPTTGYYFIAWK